MGVESDVFDELKQFIDQMRELGDLDDDELIEDVKSLHH